MRAKLTLACLTLPGLLSSAAMANGCDTPSSYPVPRFVSLATNEANGRTGPSMNHSVAWKYVRRGLPVQVVMETATWRRVRDPSGEEVWMHESLLSGRRSVYALSEATLRARPEADAVVEAIAEAGAILWLERCRTGWCRLESNGLRGWTEASQLWGVYANEPDAAAGDSGQDPCRLEPQDALTRTASLTE